MPGGSARERSSVVKQGDSSAAAKGDGVPLLSSLAIMPGGVLESEAQL